MPSDAASFFESFFCELAKHDIPFVILHGYEELPDQMPSDIDYAVRCEDIPRLLNIQRGVARQHGWVLASVVQAKLYAQYAVYFDPQEPSRFIQLDACGHSVELGCFMFRDDQLLHDRRPHRFFFAPNPAIEFGYLLAKALIKRKPMSRYLPRLQRLWESDPQGGTKIFHDLVGDTVGDPKDWFSKPASEWEEQLMPRVYARTRFGILNSLKECFRAVRRILRPVGMRIVIMGPDGVGKSTLIAQLCLPCFRRMKQFHFRPGVLGKKITGAPVTQPHAQVPRSRAASFAKTFYYFLDHWIGHILKTFPSKVRNELVVFDRSFEDIFIDPKRYRLAGAETMARILRRFLPKPELTIILDADPAIVHARKPELSLEELSRQREVFRQLAGRLPRCIVISAAQTPEQVVRAAHTGMLAFLSDRENRWHGS